MPPKTDFSAIADFPAAAQLACALWQNGASLRRAACLIGAGFSRNALMAAKDTPRPPLWPDLDRAMTADLYPGDAKGAPSNPLRLAEEYRTYFGQAALDDLIRSLVRDEAWRPGPAHEALLKLPWTDVLTTNWDTLLEKAARQITSRYYSTVKSFADLGHAQSPRIIKLHGTIGVSDHFVLAEEDYRTYPKRYAPFVNLARQVFIENELVLLGFSGDDPNFLQWSGWVRDQLGSSARRIYLVGVLALGPAKRKLLEAMNVTPIDLAPLVETEPDPALRHTRAMELFLQMLAESAPPPRHNWSLSRSQASMTPTEWERERTDDAYAASVLERGVGAWKGDREGYPGWLVCPFSKRFLLGANTNEAQLVTSVRLALINPKSRLSVLYELAWRHNVAFWPIPSNLRDVFAEEVMKALPDSGRPDAPVRSEHLEIAVLLLRTARLAGDNANFEKWASIINEYDDADNDLRAAVGYQRSLWARDHLDFDSMLLPAAAIKSGRDPAWRLRLAAVHCWCGDFEEARRLLASTVAELNDRQAEDRSSIWLRSRRAWAQWLARAANMQLSGVPPEPWSQEFREIQADPWDEIESLREDAEKDVRKRLEARTTIQPLFSPGHFRDKSDASSFGRLPSAHALDFLQEVAGIPERFEHVNLVERTAKDIVELAYEAEEASAAWYHRWLRVLFDYSDPSIERYLSRVCVARMTVEVAQDLITTVTKAINFWRQRVRRIRLTQNRYDTYAVSRLRFFVEIMSRLTARQSAVEARQSVALAVDLSADPTLRHMWLREQVGRLAEHAVKAMPIADRTEIVLDALAFPLPGEWAAVFPGYESPIAYLFTVSPGRPSDDSRWTSRIAELIEATTQDDNRKEASLRLLYLAEHSALTENERQRFSQGLWSAVDDVDPPLPRDTSLYPHSFSRLPAPEGVDAQDVVRRRLYGPSSGLVGGSWNPLDAITAAATAPNAIFPSHDQAIRLFENIIKWRPTPNRDPLVAAFEFPETRLFSRAIGPALAKAIVPAFRPSHHTVERGRALMALINEASVASALWALPFFVWSLDDDDSLAFIHRIRRGLTSRRYDEVSAAALAISTWADLAAQGRKPAPPSGIIDQVCSSLESPPGLGFDNVLQAARQLIKMHLMAEGATARVAAALEHLADNLSYDALGSDDEMAVAISLARVECVRLAATLEKSGLKSRAISRWLEVASSDPLPEVRFALEGS